MFATAALMAIVSFQAYAATPGLCGPRGDVLAQLGKNYREAPVAVGLAKNGSLVEVLASPDGATWTIILSMPGGMSCLMAAGEGWRQLNEPAFGEGL